jgi:hypothetical protein
MSTQMKLWARQILKALAPVPLLLGLNLNAQTTTPGVKVDVLGTGAESLLGKPLTDPEGDGLDALGAATDPSWNWKNITSSHEPDFEGGENSFNIFDHKVGGGNDKWCCDDPTADAPVWVSVEFKQGVSLTHFTVTSGNDTPGRDPVNWAIQGSNDGTTFVDIYRFVDATTPWGDTRNLVVKFTLPSPSLVYSHIRYIAFDTPATLHQLNEIEYFGTVGAPKPAIANGLKAYWNFDGNLKDTAGGAVKFDGSENGASPIAFPNGKAGFGKSMLLDGVDQFVEITGGEPDDLAFQGGSMTVAGWFKVGAFDKSWQALIAKGEGSNWRIHRRGGETGFAHAGGVGEGPAGAAVDDGNWHHFTAISDHTGANFGTRLYVDGVNYTEFATAANLSANGKRVMIGENPDARGRTWNGEVDDIAIWDRVLTEPEIASLYAGGKGVSLGELLNAVVGDADKDGMPDSFEVENGFNPNDPSDAAKDFDKDGVSNLDEFKAGTNPSDVTAPTIVSVAATGDFKTVNITFSEEVDPAAAVVLANYTITPNLTISAATYRRKVVTLTTAAQAPGATKYTVAVKGVIDTSKNAIAAGTEAVFYSYLLSKDGALRFAAWTGIGGNAVQALFDDPRYPATPDITGAVFSINSREVLPTDSLESYGAIMEGFITPAESGDYDFMLRSDDGSELFLSSDDKEANLASIAFESGCCDAFKEPGTGDETTLAPIALVANKKYFIRVVYKEGGGGDYGQVAWRKTTDKTPAASLQPIPSRFLSSAVDLPAAPEGAWVTQSPAPNAKGVLPVAKIRLAHRDGKTAWTSSNVTLKFDGQAVTPTFTKVGSVLTMDYDPNTLFASASVHTVTVGYVDAGGNPATYEYSFTAAAYSGKTADKVAGYPALLQGSSVLTADATGHTGKAGDKAIDLTMRGGPVATYDAAFLAAANAATAKDELSVAFWQKKLDVADSSAFTLHSPSAGNNRGFHAHVPWSNQEIYFDTTGCCDASTQRINAPISGFAGYSGEATWWTTSWHLFVFTKKGASKNIYVDGELFHSGENTNPLFSDHTAFYMGSGAGAGELSHAIIDDFAVFGKELTAANVTALKNGTAPTALPAATGLIAYWPFDSVEVAATAPVLGVARGAAGKVTLTFEGTLQSSATAAGPYTDVAGASPLTVDATDAKFYRAKR